MCQTGVFLAGFFEKFFVKVQYSLTSKPSMHENCVLILSSSSMGETLTVGPPMQVRGPPVPMVGVPSGVIMSRSVIRTWKSHKRDLLLLLLLLLLL